MKRRAFLKLFSASALAAIAPVDLLARIENKRFVSDALHFSMEIPAGWYRPGIEDVRLNFSKQTFVNENISNDEVSPTPLVVFICTGSDLV